MEGDGWVEGKALDTVIALNGIQPGDEIVVAIDKWEGGSRTCIVDSNEPFGIQKNGILWCVCKCMRTCDIPYHLPRDQLVAWRPKRRPRDA